MPLSIPPWERKVLCRDRNRDNLYLKVFAIPAEIKSRETKDCSESHLFKVGYNDKDGRSIFTFTLTFVPNESIRSYMLDMRFSLSALRTVSHFYLIISALCHSHLARFIARFAIPRAFDTRVLVPQLPFGLFLLRVCF